MNKRLKTSNDPKALPAAAYSISDLEVLSYSPGPVGAGVPCTEVHLMIRIDGLNAPLIMRMKSAAAVDSLVEALLIHREDVFGKGDEQ